MPSPSNLENTISQERSLHQRNAQSFDGEFAAKVFKYYRSLQNPYKSKSFPLKLVSGKALYNSHKVLFDKFAAAASKNNFDIESYLKYCVRCGMTESTSGASYSKFFYSNNYNIDNFDDHQLY